MGRFSSLLSSRSTRSPSSWFWRGKHFDRGWNKEAEKIKMCQKISSFSASGAKYIILKGLFGSRPQLNNVRASFRQWYASIEKRIFLVALHGGSSIALFYFRPLFRRSCHHSDQRDRSPAGHSLSLDLYWVYQLWAQFSLSAVLFNVDVTWSRDEVLVGIHICPVFST